MKVTMASGFGVYDFIVVGAGSAGCVLAQRLSADGRHSVLLLEAGGYGRNPIYDLPMLAAALFQKRSNNWFFYTEPQPGLNGRRIFLPRGKAIGGSFVFNGAQYIRGHRSDFDHWRQLGNEGWAYADVLPYFKRSESYENGETDYHGAGGGLAVNKLAEVNPLSHVFLRACHEAGYALNDDFNGAEQDGFGLYDFNVSKGRRCTTARAFLYPALKRPNLRVEVGVDMRRVLIEQGRAVGVEVRRSGVTLLARARREVILATGSINTPKLLMLSGIGDGEALKRHGIEVEAHLPGVGANLQDHLTVSVGYRCTQPISLVGTLRLDRLAVAVARGVLLRRGPVVRSPLEAGGFMRTQTGLQAPDCQVVFLPIHVSGAQKIWMPWAQSADDHSFALRVWPNRPESRGQLTLASADPDADPIIDPMFFTAGSDIAVTREGVRHLRRIAAQPAFDAYRGIELQPGADVVSDDELDAFIREKAGTGHHTCGTARMGHDPMAVVDDQLRVHGIAGLRVADASIMPTMVSGNTNAATIMIGEKASDLILGRQLPRDEPGTPPLAQPWAAEAVQAEAGYPLLAAARVVPS
ncbi:MAG: choline dehydrogenase [Geminicoccaceae bacterium]